MAEPESSSKPIPTPRGSNNNGNNKWEGASTDSEAILTPDMSGTPPDDNSLHEHAVETPTLGPTVPKSPGLSRNPSFSGSSSYQEDWDPFPPLDRLTVLDILDNFALSQQIEKLQKGISAQTEKVRKSREALGNRSRMARERMVDEWRRRVPSAEEQLDRYRRRMRNSVEKLGARWNDTKAITLREKISFICGVMNIFVSGYLIGGYPEWFHLWYTVQVLYFMPIRFYTYHKRGYHYFLADLCYFVNALLMLSIWAFPTSKRLFTAVYCLAYGNNAVAIIMWRNSLVFHSFDKVTSLFIHIMPCATLHCIVHLLDPAEQRARFPAIWTIKNSPPGSATAYANLFSMLAWSSIPYAVWQLSYYFFITVRRREKIAAGRPTSFTWLRKSYSKVWIGKIVLALPDALQEPAFMLIQYTYAVLTMLPCPLWFFSRWASGTFLMVVFAWSVYNGSTYYIDVFGKRFQKELEAMKAEVAKWQQSPDYMMGGLASPTLGPHEELGTPGLGGIASAAGGGKGDGWEKKNNNIGDGISGKALDDNAGGVSGVDNIPLLNDERPAAVIATGMDMDGGAMDVARERRANAGPGGSS
ncbi:uncharacterized protein B0T15DRAFT_122821 [Chaetomium strumarium]|uniref:Glycerophosphocholine acyltransferase 1 n=1 Tax=Chaetomium strumarium TaxID=1170767 RepID=A0AAJ0GZA2_9PEZI|nr:hypothetical protein B0T15DRAFT_122821 [Chaetomium strumarium]